MSDEKELRLKEFPNWREHFEWRFLSDNYAPCRLLDYGCGYGFSDLYLAGLGFEVHGYDPDKERIEVAEYIRAYQSASVQRLTRFSSSHWLSHQYGLIWSSHVFEHIPHDRWENILDIFEAMFAPVLLSVPLGYAYDMPEHIHHWATPDDFKADLERFSRIKWEMSADTVNKVIRAKGVL